MSNKLKPSTPPVAKLTDEGIINFVTGRDVEQRYERWMLAQMTTVLVAARWGRVDECKRQAERIAKECGLEVPC